MRRHRIHRETQIQVSRYNYNCLLEFYFNFAKCQTLHRSPENTSSHIDLIVPHFEKDVFCFFGDISLFTVSPTR